MDDAQYEWIIALPSPTPVISPHRSFYLREQEHDLWLFDTQLERWQTGTLTDRQRKEVERLAGQMRKLHAAIADILAMAAELSKGTLEKQMAKSDEQLGLEYLMRMFDGEEKQR